MRRAGKSEQEIQDAQLDSVRSLAKNYTVIARLTGKQISQIQDETIARNREGSTLATVRLLEKQGIEGVEEAYEGASTALIKAPKVVQDAFRDYVDKLAPLTEETKLFTGISGEAAATLMEAAKAARRGDTEEATRLAEKSYAQTIKFADTK